MAPSSAASRSRDAKSSSSLRPYLRPQPFEPCEPLFDRRQPLGIDLDGVRVALEFARGVGQLGGGGAQPLGLRTQRRVDCSERFEATRSGVDAVDRSGRVGLQRIPAQHAGCGARFGAQVRRVDETRVLARECVEFAGLQRCGVQLAQLECDEVTATRTVVGVRCEPRMLGAQRAQRSVSALDALAQREEPAERVEQSRVTLGTPQALGLVLTRNLETLTEQLGEYRHRHEATGHPCAAATLAADAARDDEGVVLDIESALAKAGLEIGRAIGAKHRLDARFVGARRARHPPSRDRRRAAPARPARSTCPLRSPR